MPRYHITRRALLEGLATGIVLAQPAARAMSPEAGLVDLRGGRVRGRDEGAVISFKGIPYAVSKRFRSPEAVSPWTGVLTAFKYGAPSIQNNTEEQAWKDPIPGNENCQFLNVWTPSLKPGKLKPIMLWFHGGAYSTGSGGLEIYSGANLARSGDVVVVTVNHRLNIFGYLWLGDIFPALLREGNLGHRDLVASLIWVRDNIQAFGGDPANVTIFGESGGGGKVSSMLATSAAKGLFHKAIVESGSQLAVQGRPEATRTARLVLAELGVDSADATALDALSSEALHAAATSIESRLGELAFQPVLDGDVLTHQTWTPAAPAESAGIPMIIGTTSQEGAGFLPKMREPITSDGEMIARFRESLVGGALSDPQIQSTTDRYRQILPKATRLELLVAIVTDTFMLHSAIIQAERKVAQGQEAVYVYEFAWKTPCFGATWALHGIELPFVFGNLRYGVAWDSADSESVRAVADPHNDRVRLAKETMRAWTAFAHTGSPSTRALPWPAYNLGDRRTMVFDHVSRVLADPAEARRKVLADLPPAW